MPDEKEQETQKLEVSSNAKFWGTVVEFASFALLLLLIPSKISLLLNVLYTACAFYLSRQLQHWVTYKVTCWRVEAIRKKGLFAADDIAVVVPLRGPRRVVDFADLLPNDFRHRWSFWPFGETKRNPYVFLLRRTGLDILVDIDKDENGTDVLSVGLTAAFSADFVRQAIGTAEGYVEPQQAVVNRISDIVEERARQLPTREDRDDALLFQVFQTSLLAYGVTASAFAIEIRDAQDEEDEEDEEEPQGD